MALKFNNGKIIFSSGKRRYAHDGTIGIQIHGDDFEIGYGADGMFYCNNDQELSLYDDEEKELRLTREDIIELSDHMIDKWAKLRRKLIEETWTAQ